jgi:hypothetical protein
MMHIQFGEKEIKYLFTGGMVFYTETRKESTQRKVLSVLIKNFN